MNVQAIEDLKLLAEKSDSLAREIEEGKEVGDVISPKVKNVLEIELEIRTIIYSLFATIIPVIVKTVLLYPELFRAISAFIRTLIPLIGIGFRIIKICKTIFNRVSHDKEVMKAYTEAAEKVIALEFKLMDELKK